MLGLDYGSDSEDDSTTPQPTTTVKKSTTTTPTAGPSSISAKLALPPPSKSTLLASKAPGSSLSLPPPKAKKPAKKILVELPKLSKHASDNELEDSRPALKKPRLNGRAASGKSSALLSMLPAPKKSTLELPKPERVLGGGRSGLAFSAQQTNEVAPPVADTREGEGEEYGLENATEGNGLEEVKPEKDTTTSMIPPSMLLKGKGKANTKPPPSSTAPEPAVDFFSLGSTASARISSAPRIPSPPSSSFSSTPSLSAAPKVEEFTPPSPKQDDPYPGYYQLPSGAWAMHDAAYYKSHYDRWQKEYEAQIRAYEKSNPSRQRGFEGAVAAGASSGAGIEDVNASELADLTHKEREEKKKLTEGAQREGERAMPRMTVNPSKMSGVARSRHQLGTMLMEAYMNREVLEEKIAQGKRNRKEAGNKYGF